MKAGKNLCDPCRWQKSAKK